MKILFALGHPAHFHFFKNVISKIKEKENFVFITIKRKDILEELLQINNLKYVNLYSASKKRIKNSFFIFFDLLMELIVYDFRLLIYVIKKKPDILIGTNIQITHIGKMMRIPSIVFNEDDFEINKLFCKTAYPFAKTIVSPYNCNVGKKFENKRISYNGYQKLAYLHPNQFTPSRINIPEQPYFFIRLVNLNAGHDIEENHKGIELKILQKIIHILEKKGRVFISSEKKLSKEFSKYEIINNKNNIHNFMFFSDLIIADSQSMIVEAAMLGIPNIRFNSFVGRIKILEDLENKYGLTYGINSNNPEKLFLKINEILTNTNIKNDFQIKRSKMLTEKIDVTAFMVWFIENYPESVTIMKENPDYQYNFK